MDTNLIFNVHHSLRSASGYEGKDMKSISAGYVAFVYDIPELRAQAVLEYLVKTDAAIRVWDSEYDEYRYLHKPW